MNIEEYRKTVHEDIALATLAGDSNSENEFLSYSIGLLVNGEEFDDFVECSFEGVTKQNRNMRIDGYAKDETDGSCCVFLAQYKGPDADSFINAEDINSAFRQMRLFIEEATRRALYLEMKNDTQAAEFARDLYFDSETITKYRLYFLTDAFNQQLPRAMKDAPIGEKTVELNIWDINRLFELVSSFTQKESIEINLIDFGLPGIPCVKAVDCVDVIADIDTVPGLEGESIDSDEKPANIVTYSSYLAVVPGQILNDLYLEYGAKLLEGNVRSFLSVRGKVNKSIQNTVKNYPEMFFAYNNGIAATATELDVEMTADGPIITRIKDLQIVNGGQTTATIANALLSAKKNEKIDISHLYVPMKISVLEHSMAERIIPKISEYSNSQNKVEASDFFSNHPFHKRMEEYSRKTSIPAINGRPSPQYWFYERTRGQYNQGKMKFGAKSLQLKQYKEKYPEDQVITMLDLARYMEIYECAPYIVSKGKQNTLQVFAEKIKKDWQKSDISFNAYYYKRVVALAILYRRTDELIKQTDWYKEKKSYKANVIAYTLSLIFDYIRAHEKGYELDFNRIWNTQDIYAELEEQILVLSKEVHDFITGPRDTENVTEWCKREACWMRAKSQIWTFNVPFLYTLAAKSDSKLDKKEEETTRKLENEIDAIKEILARGSEYWQKVFQWGNSRRLLSEKEASILKMVVNMNITGRVPSDKQAQVVMRARQRLIEEGMPMQF